MEVILRLFIGCDESVSLSSPFEGVDGFFSRKIPTEIFQEHEDFNNEAVFILSSVIDLFIRKENYVMRKMVKI